MTYMIAAYSVIWLLTFVFIASIFVRQRRLRRDVTLMEQLLETDRTQQSGS
jgi:CcmD family protein